MHTNARSDVLRIIARAWDVGETFIHVNGIYYLGEETPLYGKRTRKSLLQASIFEKQKGEQGQHRSKTKNIWDNLCSQRFLAGLNRDAIFVFRW